MILAVISGGQTGVDRGALDAALAAGVLCGGFCPRGRSAEDGAIPARYPLVEVDGSYPIRTASNVLAANATLILCRGALGRGSALTRKLAARYSRPALVLDLAESTDPGGEACAWLERLARSDHALASVVLNVAGARESAHPGIQAQAEAVVDALLLRSGAIARL